MKCTKHTRLASTMRPAGRSRHSFFRTKTFGRGQAQTQIFIYIVAIVMLGLIMIFGYQAVSNFGKKSSQVEYISFKSDVESSFKVVSSSYGQIKIKEFSLPSTFEEMCFVNINYPGLEESDFDFNPLLFSGIQENKNVFVLKGITFEGFYVGNITVDSDGNNLGGPRPIFDGDQEENGNGNPDSFVLCVEHRQGKVKLLLEGKGDHVFVAQG